MAEKDVKIVEEEGTVVADVTPEDILGALDDDVIPADDIEGDDEPEGDVTPTGEDEGEDTWEEPEQEPPEIEDEPLEEPVETEEPKSELVPAKVMYQGTEYEVMVTPEAAKAIEAQQMTAQQLPSLQGRYDELKEQVQGLTTLPGTTADQTGQPQFSQEEFERTMQPRITQAVESGTITEGFAKEFPAETAYGVWLFDAVREMAGTLHGVSSNIVRDERSAELDRFTQGVYGTMGEIAAENPQVFGELADQANRETFFEFVVKANPTVGQMSGDEAKSTIEGLYAWYKKDEMSAGVVAAQAKAKADHDDARLRAGGAGGGGGSRSKPKSRHPDIDEVVLGD
jgi:hypothetical protein